MTPMYERRRHSPSEMMSNPAASWRAITYGVAASSRLSYTPSGMVPSARGSSRSRRNCGRGMLPTTPAANGGNVGLVLIAVLAPFFLRVLVVLGGVDLEVLAVGIHLA